MAKKSGTKKGLRKTSSSKKAGARAAKASKGSRRKTAATRTPKGKARRKQLTNPPRAGKLKRAARKTAAPARRKTAPRATSRTASSKRGPSTRLRAGGTGREETLAQTPETGRTRLGRTNPFLTRRSTGTAAGAGTIKSPRLERARRQLREIEETVPTPPSSLDLGRQGASAARSGRQRLQEAKADHNETSPVMTGGDVDADWEDAYSVGDEAPGGDNPTPDQDRVDDIGKALGVTYEDNEELKAADKIAERDKHRWELDPASSEDYTDRD
jgi:Family of unknown function (DUF6335)